MWIVESHRAASDGAPPPRPFPHKRRGGRENSIAAPDGHMASAWIVEEDLVIEEALPSVRRHGRARMLRLQSAKADFATFQRRIHSLQERTTRSRMADRKPKGRGTRLQVGFRMRRKGADDESGRNIGPFQMSLVSDVYKISRKACGGKPRSRDSAGPRAHTKRHRQAKVDWNPDTESAGVHSVYACRGFFRMAGSVVAESGRRMR